MPSLLCVVLTRRLIARTLRVPASDGPRGDGAAVARQLDATLAGVGFTCSGQLLAHVTGVARSLAAKSPLALRGTKHAITYARDHSVPDALDHIATWNAAVLVSEDLDEAVAAAMEKRAPVYPD